MGVLTNKAALDKQHRDVNAYLEQADNVICGIFRLLGWWLVISSGFYAFLVTSDLTGYSLKEVQLMFFGVAGGSAMATVGLAVAFNVGKFRNVFADRARAEVEKQKAVRAQIQQQIDTTERVLVGHGLITRTEAAGSQSSGEFDSDTTT